MILFDLKCDKEHLFEAWFEDSKSFEKQLKNKLVKCPICNTHKISKSIMSPNISSKSNSSSKLNKKKKDTYAAYNKYLKKDPEKKDSESGYNNFCVAEMIIDSVDILELHHDGHIRFEIVHHDKGKEYIFLAT